MPVSSKRDHAREGRLFFLGLAAGEDGCACALPRAGILGRQDFQDYAGEPFDSLIAPRVQEAIKEVAASQSAEQIVKNREEEVKTIALSCAAKINSFSPTSWKWWTSSSTTWRSRPSWKRPSSRR